MTMSYGAKNGIKWGESWVGFFLSVGQLMDDDCVRPVKATTRILSVVSPR